MKSTMPFHGVAVPAVRRIVRGLVRAHPFANADAWQAAILSLWRNASHREERYAAVELLCIPQHLAWITPPRLPLIEELVVTGAWWDYVDAIASNGVGTMLRSHPGKTKPALRQWAKHDDIWKRRSAILAQIKFKDATDEKLLHTVIEPSIGEREFFLRKAIGWALREYSKTNPAFVIDYVQNHADRLSGLSKREALKALLRQSVVGAVP